MKYVKNVLVVLVTIFFLPLLYFLGEWYDLFWLRLITAILVIPTMIWWGAVGYNKVFGKDKNKEDAEA